MIKLQLHIIVLLSVLMAACGTQKIVGVQDSAPSSQPPNMTEIPNATPKFEEKSRGGNPASYQVFGKTYYVLQNSEDFVQRGAASWYGTKFHGRKTSNGETYNMYAMSAAHKTLPIPTYLEVTNLQNGKKVIIRVNDRGPFHDDRIIDLSYVAAAKLDMLSHGTAQVEIRSVGPNSLQSKSVITPITKPVVKNTPVLQTPPVQQAAASANSLFIQIGAFKNQSNAQQITNKLNQSGLTLPHITNKQDADPLLYIVRTGPYESIKQADMDRLKIQKLGIHNPHYVHQE